MSLMTYTLGRCAQPGVGLVLGWEVCVCQRRDGIAHAVGQVFIGPGGAGARLGSARTAARELAGLPGARAGTDMT